ncbi:MAG: anhydro-N-acetylmuramic acid kinase, partial [Bacteroidota bacterium]
IEDTLATLNRFSADTIAESLRNFLGNQSDYAIYASGGGFHNPLLIENIQQQLPQTKIQSTAELGIHPDAKEAVLFAVLANECVAGNRSDIGNSAMGIPAVSMGKLSFVD